MALFLGLISGTSMDAIDAALVDVEPRACRVRAARSVAYDAALRSELFDVISQPASCALDRIGRLDTALGEAFATTALELLAGEGIAANQIAAIGSHGQTLRHQPEGAHPFTWQIADPNVIAERTGIPTVADFRRRDVAAGGEGAPLMSAFHHAVLGDAHEARGVLNLGGIANITWLATDGGTYGFDTGPASCLMDGWVERHQGAKYDRNGQWAAGGKVHQELLQRLLAEPYFARRPPKSTGRELFNLAWLDAALSRHPAQIAAQDVQATLCELSAASIAAGIEQAGVPARVIVCGGGAHNADLLRRLGARVAAPIEPSNRYGIDGDFVEAAGFAWLASQTLAGLAGNIPSVTGARHAVVLGAVYAGRL